MLKSTGVKKINIAVFISGTGTNFKNLIQYSLKKQSKFKIKLVVSNNLNAKGLEYAKKGKIINIHPSLLPKYKGLNTHQRALDNKEKYSGCTVHFVNSKLDAGKIILQKKVKIFKNDTGEKLSKRILKQEHLLYPKAVEKIISSL